MRHMLRFGLPFLFVMLLAGCGQKGPLYLPGDEQSIEQYDPAGEHPGSDQQSNGDAKTAPVDDEG